MTPEELEVLAGIDVDEYFVESIIDHEERLCSGIRELPQCRVFMCKFQETVI